MNTKKHHTAKISLHLNQGPCRGDSVSRPKQSPLQPKSYTVPVKYCQTSSFVARVLNHLQIPQLALPLPDASGRGPGGGVENPSVAKNSLCPLRLCGESKTQQYRALQTIGVFKIPEKLGTTRSALGGAKGRYRSSKAWKSATIVHNRCGCYNRCAPSFRAGQCDEESRQHAD